MKTVALLILLLIGFTINAQSESITEKIQSGKRTRIAQINPETTKSTTVVSSSFANENVIRDLQLSEITILKIYYIYTAYKQSPSFNQKALDLQRISQLNQLLPGIASDPYIEWEIVEQTGCTNPSEGDDYFHGFVIVHQPRSTKEERSREIEQLEQFLNNPSAEFEVEELDPLKKELGTEETSDSPVNIAEDSKAQFKDGPYALHQFLKTTISPAGDITLYRDDEWVKTEVDIAADGRINDVRIVSDCKEYIKEKVRVAVQKMPDWTPEISGGDSIASTVNLEIRVSYSREINGIYTRDGLRPEFSKDELATDPKVDVFSEEDLQKIKLLESSAVYQNLAQLDHDEKVALVMDVTASMNPHLAGLNWWVFNNTDTLRLVSYTFFNDGDNMEDRKKKTGQVGGIYQTLLTGEVAPTIIKAMHAGNGGDKEENDLEAGLFALNSSPTADAILLIVDNNCGPRDLDLLRNFNKKVHIMICGKTKRIRLEYLNIAKATGGDVFVNGRRVKIQRVQPGGQIVIGETTYFLTEKGFEMR